MLVIATSAVVGGACASVGSAGPLGTATDAEWRALSRPRPPALSGAARVSISQVEFLGRFPWNTPAAVAPALGVEELVVAGLLRRRDVRFIERRRFAAAVEAIRNGVRPAPGAPPPGISESADFITTAVWIPVGSGQASVEVRLSTLETGAVAGATRLVLSDDADPVMLARTIVNGVLQVLDDLDRLPVWDDGAGRTGTARERRVSTDALASFFAGLASEESWDWEGARRGYQTAARDATFHEASTALARAARLRLGGTLGES
jgi:hypothetical protein